jgi:hypothetical protein
VDFQGPREQAAALQAVVRQLANCIRPISLIEDGSGGKRFTGSALVVATGLRRIVITAEHVVSGPETKFLGVSEVGGSNWPKEYFRVVPVDETEAPTDIAFAVAEVALDNPDDSGRSLPIELLYPGHHFAVGTSMVAVGFPGSKAKSRDGQTRLNAKLMSVVGDLASEDVYIDIGKKLTTHLAMTFRQDACVDEHNQPAPAAHPKGMSGGAMFVAAYDTDHEGRSRFVPRVVGLLTEYHRAPIDVIVAVRIDVVLDALGIRPDGAQQRYRAVDV